jgi:hypothetical protein
MPLPPTRIAVFARQPVAGRVKTRLAPLLGADGALALHRQLIESTLFRARDAMLGAVTLWIDGDLDDTEVQLCARRQRVAVAAQRGDDLGARMHHALTHTLADGGQALLIGTDCPALTPQHLQQAAAALATHALVLIPAHDGGYVLVGASASAALSPSRSSALSPSLSSALPRALFEGIAWGGDTVLAATRARIAAQRLSCAELAPLPDLDTADDYRAALAAGWIVA